MSDLKHTPERWYWTETSGNCPQMLMRSLNGGAPDYVLIPQVDLSDYGLSLNPWVDISKKDQRLIEATPLLLMALRTIERVGRDLKDSGWGGYQDGYAAGLKEAADIARAAIAAAEGDA